MARFVNPYNFVALGKSQRNNRIAFHHKFSGKSGVVECSLEALTRIFIPSRLKKKGEESFHKTYHEFFHCEGNKTPVIPGSSIKGMLRSVVEAMTGGCLSTFMAFYKKGKDVYDYSSHIDDFLPPGLKSNNCSVAHGSLCYACHLFGTMDRFNPIIVYRGKAFKSLDATLDENEDGKNRAEFLKELEGFSATEQKELKIHPNIYGIKADHEFKILKIKRGDILLKINGQQVTKDNYTRLLKDLTFIQTGHKVKSVLRGKLEITDAQYQYKDGKTIQYDSEFRRLKTLLSPNPNHVPFYSSHPTDLQILGRKFYYHHPDYNNDDFNHCCCNNDKNKSQHLNITIRPLLRDSRFSFKVYFNNMTDAELGLLLWALELDNKEKGDEGLLAHKIGIGKPVGLGSCKIKVTRLEIIEPTIRYTKYRVSDENVIFPDEKNNLAHRIERLKNEYSTNPFAEHLDLKRILTFGHKNGKPIHYPDKKSWFDKDKDKAINHSNKTKLPPELNSDGTPNPYGGELDKIPSVQITKATDLPYKKVIKHPVTQERADSMTQSFGDILKGQQQGKAETKNDEILKIGQKIRGKIIRVTGLKGTAQLDNGDVVEFTRNSQYQPASPDKRATFVIKRLSETGKVNKLELERLV